MDAGNIWWYDLNVCKKDTRVKDKARMSCSGPIVQHMYIYWTQVGNTLTFMVIRFELNCW